MASGIKLPVEEVEKIYNEYKERTATVDKQKDSFFDKIGSMGMDEDDSMFNLKDASSKNPTTDRKTNFFDAVEDKSVVTIKVGKKSKKDDFFDNY